MARTNQHLTQCNRFGDLIRSLYKVTSPFPTRPIREITFKLEHPQLVSFRDSLNGPFQIGAISKQQKKGSGKSKATSAQQPSLVQLYPNSLPISKEKFKDLQDLKKFCRPENYSFLNDLPTA
ncbi:hypothetical protein RRG08_005717 [Elysia crispata]|uniref:Uncharacterized protein n=1 Tax=Elysia crispata TaxID=231223 RepID=A0AAE0YCP5_9GAST|nr:hypothetical protein RRG08_005717 [Elysia crispata]